MINPLPTPHLKGSLARGQSGHLGSLTAVFMRTARTRSQSDRPVPDYLDYLMLRPALPVIRPPPNNNKMKVNPEITQPYQAFSGLLQPGVQMGWTK